MSNLVEVILIIFQTDCLLVLCLDFLNQVLMLCSRLDDIAFELLASVKGFLQRADNLDLSHPSARNLRHPAETGWPMPKTDTHTNTL